MAQDGLLRRYRDPLIVLVLLALPFVLFVSNSKEARDHNFFDRAVVTVSAPFQWVVRVTVESVISGAHHYVYLVGTEEENLLLNEEVGRLRGQIASNEENRLETERLRGLLGVRERAHSTSMVHARVVAMASSPLFRSVRIDRGSSDGVRVGAAVVNADGVVGRVAAVATSYSDVMLLVDANSSTDVLVQRTRARARVRGFGGDQALGIQVEYLSRTSDVQPGDILITSGVGEVFPKGLRVGRVIGTETRAFGLYQNATIDPAVDVGKLEDVLVVTGGWDGSTTFEAPEVSMFGPVAPDVLEKGEGVFKSNAVEARDR
ncbi:MAG: rod shape-determining protein MreC [Clostridia bacterium]|nr:rod shape-determining protein MreC [Deltaproteobacteria bacterium]